MKDIQTWTVSECVQQLEQKNISSQELTEFYLRRIQKMDSELHCFLRVDAENALESARQSDHRRKLEQLLSPLDGVPFGLKDIFVTEGLETTCGSRILENYKPPFDSTVSQRLKDSGMVLLGKLNMDEFAMGSSNENSGYGVVRNPWNLEMVPGGSSGGSAAAVAAGLCPVAMGSDTGGSIRLPASFCGISGIKPTYGRVSRYGMIAYASSLDQGGPMARDLDGCSRILDRIAGVDSKDSTTSNQQVPSLQGNPLSSLKGIRIGLPKEYYQEGLSPEVLETIEQTKEVLASLGAEFVEVSLPHTEYAVSTYYIVATAEASSNLSRYDGVRFGARKTALDSSDASDLEKLYKATRSEGFGQEVKRRILLGTFVLSSGYYDAYYLKAQKVRTLIQQDFQKAFQQCDVMLTPVSPFPAFRFGEKSKDPLQMYLADIFTISCNLAGIPGLSIPAGFSNQGLPIGVQLLGNYFQEHTLFEVGKAFQQKTSWHQKVPPLTVEGLKS